MAFNLADYETVEERLAKFWSENKDRGRIETEVKTFPDGSWYVVAAVHKDGVLVATGIATPDPTKKNWMAEDCETSAIGRALANAGYAPKGKRASKEEMQKVSRADERSSRQSPTAPGAPSARDRSSPGGEVRSEGAGSVGKLAQAPSSSELEDRAKAIPLRGKLKRLAKDAGEDEPINIDQLNATQLQQAIDDLKAAKLDPKVVGEIPN